MTEDCGCRITEPAGGQLEIDYCPTHEAAPDLLVALKQLLAWCEDPPRRATQEQVIRAVATMTKARDAIARTEETRE